MKYLLVLLALSLSSFKSPSELSKICEVLKHVETNNNEKAIGDNGKAYGVLQIHEAVIIDVNRYYGTNYIHYNAFEPNCAVEIFHLYINMGIEIFQEVYNRSPTEEEIVKMWNGGVYKGYLYKDTEKYYIKYLKYKKVVLQAI